MRPACARRISLLRDEAQRTLSTLVFMDADVSRSPARSAPIRRSGRRQQAAAPTAPSATRPRAGSSAPTAQPARAIPDVVDGVPGQPAPPAPYPMAHRDAGCVKEIRPMRRSPRPANASRRAASASSCATPSTTSAAYPPPLRCQRPPKLGGDDTQGATRREAGVNGDSEQVQHVGQRSQHRFTSTATLPGEPDIGNDEAARRHQHRHHEGEAGVSAHGEGKHEQKRGGGTSYLQRKPAANRPAHEGDRQPGGRRRNPLRRPSAAIRDRGPRAASPARKQLCEPQAE